MANTTQAEPIANALAGLNLADQALNGPAARSTYGVTGAGIKIGILSDSFNVNGGAAAATAQGLLPSTGVTVLKEGPAGSTDEGQAMAELIHQTAPGAQLYFYSADYSEQGFAAGIQALTAAGCQVIVDDIAWEDEPFFQLAGPIDTAAAQAVAHGVTYFSAAGNEGSAFFQGAFTPGTSYVPGIGPTTAEQFPGGSPYQTVTIPAGMASTLSLQWEAPYTGNNPPVLTIAAVGANGTVTTSFQVGSEPTALLNFPVSQTTQSYRVYVAQTPGTTAPPLFKYVLEGAGSIAGQGVGTGSGSIIGHDLVPGVNAVGAMNVAQTPAEGGTLAPEAYTGTGPGQLLLGANGAVLAQPQTLHAPAFLAPDGANTSVFAPFLGTSAAAAEAAAVAALMLQANPRLTNTEVSTLMADSALPAGAASVAGAGLIQANLAVQYAESGVISGSPQATVRGMAQAPDTINGGSGTQALVAGAGPTLMQSFGANDTVSAGTGADTVNLLGRSALLFGGTGSLLVTAMDGADTIAGGGGAVSVNGGTGGGQEFGSPNGHNRLVAGNAPTWLVQGGAADTLIGAGGGNDTLVATGSGAATLLGGGSAGSVFVATGSRGADLILPGAGGNLVYLGAGADTVIGGTGSINLQAGSGAQLAFGGSAGGNALRAGSGAATLVGGGGNDTLIGQGAGDLLVAAATGNDTLVGGTGPESLVGSAGGVNVFLAGASDAVIAPQAAAAVIGLGSGDATLALGSGNTLLNLVNGQGGGEDFINGFDPAHDLLRLAGYGSGGSAAIAAQIDTGGNAWVTLPDGTRLAFIGLGHLSAANVLMA